MPRHRSRLSAACLGGLALAATLAAEDGYRLWLRYDPIEPEALRTHYAETIGTVELAPTLDDRPAVTDSAREELLLGLTGLLATTPRIVITTGSPAPELGEEGYRVSTLTPGTVRITAYRSAGLLYGAFALLRQMQTHGRLDAPLTSVPRIQHRMLNHWDNLDRFVERGYAGFSLWEWFNLPDILSPRYRDYARACASIGINGTVLTNVNADALVLTPAWLEKVAALADVFRPWGIRVYLTSRFSAPIQIGGLGTADPLDPRVADWWRARVDEIYRLIPDFGGFLVKANSEGQPGPQDYGRTHAEGANMLADALAPHGGIVLWRAFVYQADNTLDRVRQASAEFNPLDGAFRDNVVLQIKNGPLDFMPREPFHPLFGSLRRTNLAAELQITQEYLGGSIHLAWLGTMWEEFLRSDTFAAGPGSTIERILDGSLHGRRITAMAGVANTGTDRNWTGHAMAQGNWYAFGRLAWDPGLSARAIAEEWTRMTFGNAPEVVGPVVTLLIGSRETVVNYSMPLGLHHIMAAGHHYGPGPWVTLSRPDWSSPYYHQADAIGLGADRGPDGSNALADYAPEIAARWGDPATCPEDLLLWFHHVPWDHRMRSGRTLWDELALRYQQGVDEVRAMRQTWDALAPFIDAERHDNVRQRLARQERDACEWRDACLLYFQQFSQRPLPAGVEPPAHPLDHYINHRLRHVPGDPADS